MFCLKYCLSFQLYFEKFQTSAAHKRFADKKARNSSLIAGQSNFLPNKTVKLVLGLYV